MSNATLALSGIEDIRALKGRPAHYSSWLHIDQAMIDRFAEATGDRQWIHVDVERAARESPFGRTIAHGFLTLSLLSQLFLSCFSFPNRKISLNYGFDRVRFTAAVESDSDVRAAIILSDAVDAGPNMLRTAWDVTLEVRGRREPALIALWLIQMGY
jgi:acyl dehydratase